LNNIKKIGFGLITTMLVSSVAPVFAAVDTTVGVDQSDKEYYWGETVTISGKADKALMYKIENKNGAIVAIESVTPSGSNKYSETIQLPSAEDDASGWVAGKYTITIDGETETFTVTKKSTTNTSGSSSSGRGSGGSGGLIIPSISGTGVISTTGAAITAILNPNQYSKYGTSAANVLVTGTKLGDNTFSVKAAINGVEYTTFTGFDPIKVKVPYTPATGANTANIVVFDANGNVIPRSYYKDGYVYMATSNIGGIFTIGEVNKSFDDVWVEWPQEAISALAARGIVNGVGDNNFDPDNYVTRAQFIKMVTAAFDVVDTSATTTFWDVDASAWYAPYVATAQQYGITLGYEDGSFAPDKQITREEMCAMLYRAADVLGVDVKAVTDATTFDDDWAISDYAKANIYAMQKADIIHGMGDGTFNPQGTSTRAQAAVAIYNMFKVSMNFDF
jgi:hypothetical protein